MQTNLSNQSFKPFDLLQNSSNLVEADPAWSVRKGIRAIISVNDVCNTVNGLGRLVFADHSSRLRTEQSFKIMLDENHHQIISLLYKLNFGVLVDLF